MKLAVLSLLVVVSLLVPVVPADAQTRCPAGHCYTYLDLGDVNCTGANGCQDTWDDEICGFGCVCGSCTNKGSSGECCGKIYYIPNIAPEDGDCEGNCGDARTHALSHKRDGAAGRSTDLLHDHTPGVIMLTRTVSYRDPRLLYVLDRCSHVYRLMTEWVPLTDGE